MSVSLILAVGPKGLIGYKDKLVWRSKKDFEFFKSHTLNKPCIFGSTTFYGLPNYPLKQRINIVLDNTQEKDITADNRGWVTCDSLENALFFSENFDEVFICGGKSVYEYALKYDFVDRVYLTKISSDWLDEMIESKLDDLVFFDVDEYIKDWYRRDLAEDSEIDSLGRKMFINFNIYSKKPFE